MKTKRIESILLMVIVGALAISCNDDDVNIQPLNDELEIVETTNLLFNYTDAFNWQGIHNEVMDDTVLLDMSSAGAGPARRMASRDITAMWNANYIALDVDEVNHLNGNTVVAVNGDEANVVTYSTATLYREEATQGQTFVLTGDYDLHFIRTPVGWRLDEFIYNLRYTEGNPTLE